MIRLSLLLVATPLLLAVPAAHAQGTPPTATPTSTATTTASPTPTAPAGTPSPTPSPTATTPSALDLIQAANAAILAKKTVHIAETAKSSGSGLTIKLGIVEDVNLVSSTGNVTVTTHLTGKVKGKKVNSVSKVVGVVTRKMMALRESTSKGTSKWSCTKLPSASSSGSGLTVGSGDGANLVSTIPADSTVTAATVDNQPSWDIHGTQPSSILATATDSIDLYVSQADGTLVKEHLKETAVHSNVVTTATANFSNYGEKVHVTLPKACAG